MTIRTYILTALTLLLGVSVTDSQSVEYSVKASIIQKIARFTEWETGAIGEYFVIGILGTSPFDGEFERLAAKDRIKNKPVRIIYIKDYHDSRDCQVLFICRSEKDDVKEIVRYLRNSNTLLVSDTPGFSEIGVHFNFYIKENETIHFEVNPKALSGAKLRTDMLLLSLGKIVN